MIARSALRASKASQASTVVARRGFHSTPARLESPYHYPEGPLSNIPFNPRTKYFGVRYWGTMAPSPTGLHPISKVSVSGENRFVVDLTKMHETSLPAAFSGFECGLSK
ncbi:MAG: hypothetical protein Q9170_008151 [Blastenia crenularia]